MNYILWDSNRTQLLPFTFTRPVSEIRIGILTIREKWEYFLSSKLSYLTEKYLSSKFPLTIGKMNMLIDSSLLPDKSIASAIRQLKPGQMLFQKKPVAICISADELEELKTTGKLPKRSWNKIMLKSNLLRIEHIWDIYLINNVALQNDFLLLTANKKSARINTSNKIFNSRNVFFEKGANASCSIINAEGGSVYIGKDAEIMEGCMIRGPFALGEHSVLKMGAKIYGATTIGPYCKVGGEVSNSVLFGYTNKAHDGFLGNSVIGEWCNLGADTNNSNLKNNYSKVRIWNYEISSYMNSGLQFAGLFMGDHGKSGINTMFNTGTVAGVCTNIFGGGFPPKYIPSFSWGGPDGFELFELNKAVEAANEMFKRRNLRFGKTEKDIFRHLFLVLRTKT